MKAYPAQTSARGQRGEDNIRRKFRPEYLELGNIKENVLHDPDAIRSSAFDRSAVGEIQLVGAVIEVNVRICDSRIGKPPSVQSVLARLILALLLRHER